MPWYSARLILYTKFLDGNQDFYPVMENIVMIHADTSDEAFDRADRKGEAEASASVDSSYTYDGRPAILVFAGVRKLNECLEYFDPAQQSSGGTEENGTEVTYSSFMLDSEDALQRLVANEDVTLVYEGRQDFESDVEGE
jgi:hypothetical protein